MDITSSQGDQETLAACIAACNECSQVCLRSIDHCLTLGGAHAEPGHIAMLMTCASVCRTASELMSINSEWHPTLCDLCAQVCDECADQCEDLGDMEDCVSACQDCADACREMVGEDAADLEEESEDEDEEPAEILAHERLN